MKFSSKTTHSLSGSFHRMGHDAAPKGGGIPGKRYPSVPPPYCIIGMDVRGITTNKLHYHRGCHVSTKVAAKTHSLVVQQDSPLEALLFVVVHLRQHVLKTLSLIDCWLVLVKWVILVDQSQMDPFHQLDIIHATLLFSPFWVLFDSILNPCWQIPKIVLETMKLSQGYHIQKVTNDIAVDFHSYNLCNFELFHLHRYLDYMCRPDSAYKLW